MRKLYLIVICLFALNSINAQVIKLQAGTTLSKLDWKIPGTNTMIYDQVFMGYSAFFGIDYLFKGNYNFSTNIGYLEKGGKAEWKLLDAEGKFTGETFKEKPQLDYISVNTTIDFNYPLSEHFLPFISAGPRVDYLLNHTGEFDYYYNNDELNSIAYGLLFGGGFKISIKKVLIGLKADYYLNFSKIAEWPESINRLKGEITDETFTISLALGYRF